MNIFNLSEEYLQLMSEIEELEGEITPEVAERLVINANNVHNKLRNYRYVILMMNGDINIIDDEIERLSKLKKSKTNAVNRLKQVMLDAVLLFGNDGKSGNKKMDFPDFKLWTTNRKSVFFFNEETFNNKEYLRYTIGDNLNVEQVEKIKTLLKADMVELEKINSSINKTLIKEELEAGVEIEGVELVTKASLTIK